MKKSKFGLVLAITIMLWLAIFFIIYITASSGCDGYKEAYSKQETDSIFVSFNAILGDFDAGFIALSSEFDIMTEDMNDIWHYARRIDSLLNTLRTRVDSLEARKPIVSLWWPSTGLFNYAYFNVYIKHDSDSDWEYYASVTDTFCQIWHSGTYGVSTVGTNGKESAITPQTRIQL